MRTAGNRKCGKKTRKQKKENKEAHKATNEHPQKGVSRAKKDVNMERSVRRRDGAQRQERVGALDCPIRCSGSQW